MISYRVAASVVGTRIEHETRSLKPKDSLEHRAKSKEPPLVLTDDGEKDNLAPCILKLESNNNLASKI